MPELKRSNRHGVKDHMPSEHSIAPVTNTRETVLKLYESARDEILMRIRLRDQVFISYLAGVAAIIGIGLGSTERQAILLLVPFLALGTTFLISQHHEVMAVLASYCVNEIGPALRGLGETTPQWDASATYAEHSLKFIKMRSCGHALLIFIPVAGALAATWKHGFFSAFPLNPLWWAGVLCAGASIFMCAKTHHFRTKTREKLHAKSEVDSFQTARFIEPAGSVPKLER
jgi:hypothetical protein